MTFPRMPGTKNIPAVLLIAWMVFYSVPAWADTVEFDEGNILRGKVAASKKGKLTFSTDYAEKTEIPFEKIQKIETDEPVTLKLTNDSILTGKLTTLEDGRPAVILEPMGESVPFQWAQVKTINEPPSHWTGHLAIGGTVQTGNVDRASVSAAFDARRNWQHDRFQFRFLHNYAEQDGT
ncbi:MAG: DUF481 domain-containing protein, partial [Nitrospinaceae bacterium]|nr:DUF481 domain-containing protein [Nitrospinaceae bacterium]NIR53603.1 DUF481 domain-containing protein [Nitrospinaceae bacterium]NIS84006.1 DUF481 domain-containing protein [Nitrospinaceae bacterium]NIT80811.1 DUF481 domain-containing protein [Nitrospinaceae bacterium]NIU43119.1 DUF481 domain-containing protein [Nitrospinaceae bacterium]